MSRQPFIPQEALADDFFLDCQPGCQIIDNLILIVLPTDAIVSAKFGKNVAILDITKTPWFDNIAGQAAPCVIPEILQPFFRSHSLYACPPERVVMNIARHLRKVRILFHKKTFISALV